jgi:hypothetical protein
MSLVKRKGSPYWIADFQIAGHRFCRSTKATTRREALAVEKLFREEELKKLKEGHRQLLTVDEAFGRFWLEVGSKYKDMQQRKDTERYIQQILAVINPNQLVEDVTDAEVNDFVQARARAQAGPIATNRALAVWRQMHRRAHRAWKQKMQTVDWRASMAKENERTNHLEFEQVRTLLTSLPDYLVLAVEWSVAAGTRRTATFSLEWANIFWDRSYAIVREKGKPVFKVWLSPQLIDILHRAKALGHPPGFRSAGWRSAAPAFNRRRTSHGNHKLQSALRRTTIRPTRVSVAKFVDSVSASRRSMRANFHVAGCRAFNFIILLLRMPRPGDLARGLF